MSSTPITPDLGTLAGLFYSTVEELGQFVEVDSSAMPSAYRQLLAHDNHMTVTVEAFHGSQVNVQVLDRHKSGSHYARKILLTKQSDGRVVQFGIMRINFSYLDAPVRRDIESEQIPLGRVLILHDLLRQVELASLWRVMPGEELRKLLAMRPGERTYGRTALIHVDSEPAVELIEIVAPVQPT